MKAHNIRELAQLIAEQQSVDKKVFDYIIKRLNTSDLKLFKKYLEQEMSKKKLFVEVAHSSKQLTTELQHLFPDQILEITENKSLGAGLSIIDGDNHYDLSIRSNIESIIDELKN